MDLGQADSKADDAIYVWDSSSPERRTRGAEPRAVLQEDEMHEFQELERSVSTDNTTVGDDVNDCVDAAAEEVSQRGATKDVCGEPAVQNVDAFASDTVHTEVAGEKGSPTTDESNADVRASVDASATGSEGAEDTEQSAEVATPTTDESIAGASVSAEMSAAGDNLLTTEELITNASTTGDTLASGAEGDNDTHAKDSPATDELTVATEEASGTQLVNSSTNGTEHSDLHSFVQDLTDAVPVQCQTTTTSHETSKDYQEALQDYLETSHDSHKPSHDSHETSHDSQEAHHGADDDLCTLMRQGNFVLPNEIMRACGFIFIQSVLSSVARMQTRSRPRSCKLCVYFVF